MHPALEGTACGQGGKVFSLEMIFIINCFEILSTPLSFDLVLSFSEHVQIWQMPVNDNDECFSNI